MKKRLLIGLAVVLAMALATGAFAFGPGYGGGYGNCPAAGGSVSPEQAQKFQKFQSDILPLRQQMIQLRTELMTLRSQTTPDWNAISAKQKQMVDLRIEIQKKAQENGLPAGGYGMGRGGRGGRF